MFIIFIAQISLLVYFSARIKLAGVLPVRLDFKGNYGVAINWNDGHYADIFPFDVLREIGLGLQK